MIYNQDAKPPSGTSNLFSLMLIVTELSLLSTSFTQMMQTIAVTFGCFRNYRTVLILKFRLNCLIFIRVEFIETLELSFVFNLNFYILYFSFCFCLF